MPWTRECESSVNADFAEADGSAPKGRIDNQDDSGYAHSFRHLAVFRNFFRLRPPIVSRAGVNGN